MSQPRVVIVGGGFAGLAAAKALKRTPAKIILIDRSNHHLFSRCCIKRNFSAHAGSDQHSNPRNSSLAEEYCGGVGQPNMALLTVVPVPISVPVSIKIPVSVPVPTVVMLPAAAISLPVTREVSISIMMRTYPASTGIWRPRPITPVPLVMPSHGIPIALDPDEFGSGTHRHRNHTGRRWRADSDSNRHLSGERRYADQEQ
jgi:hypothetical protein